MGEEFVHSILDEDSKVVGLQKYPEDGINLLAVVAVICSILIIVFNVYNRELFTAEGYMNLNWWAHYLYASFAAFQMIYACHIMYLFQKD